MQSLWPLGVIATLTSSVNVKFGLLSIKQLSGLKHTVVIERKKYAGTNYGSLLTFVPPPNYSQQVFSALL